jgi:hypothetical protein
MLGFVALLSMGVAGATAIVVGIAEQHAAENTYVVGLSRPGADCGSGAVGFDVSDGAVLSCELAGFPAGSDVADFPGFSDAQNQEVTDLAKQLGGDGLSTADQQQIQGLVDQFAATVPAAQRPHYDEGVSVEPLWGAGLAWVGAAALAVSVLVHVLVLRRRRRTQ